VRDDPPAALVVPGHVDGRVPHTGQRHENSVHLAEFDPVAHVGLPVFGGRTGRDGARSTVAAGAARGLTRR
jgi:hypothetical protein